MNDAKCAPKKVVLTTPAGSAGQPIDLCGGDSGSSAAVVSASASASSTASKPASNIRNPYKKKFVGGAERARIQARKKSRGTRILRPEERARLDNVLPKKMNSFERFFAALFHSSPRDFLEADANDSKAEELWEAICARLSLDPPKEMLPASYSDPRSHFASRSALVLEEARNAISAPLARKWKRNGKEPSGTMTLTAHYDEKSNNGSNNGHAKVVFMKHTPFTKDELFNIRPGAVFECLPRDGQRSIHNVVIGVVGSSKREATEKNRCFTVFFFRDIPSGQSKQQTEWILAPLNTLIAELRQYEAMTCKPNSIAFLNTLLGNKDATHIRFGADGDVDESSSVAHRRSDSAEAIHAFFRPEGIEEEPSMFKLPRLNHSQEKAANAFLESQNSSITIVQGPPGTGKTTLLVSVICRYVMESGENHRRLMVCAPTNKAVSVLATRFMAAMDPDHCNCNPIMVGDAEKLLIDERSSKVQGRSDALQLSSIFVFSWLSRILDDYRKIRNFFVPVRGSQVLNWSHHDLWKLALSLERRLVNSLPNLPKDIVKKCREVTLALEKMTTGAGAQFVVDHLENLLKALKDVPPDVIWRQLMHSADVIFCTLASAGGLIFKNTTGMTDLIVDEAAAATEPELCIPFQLGPKRLMIVGDPKQLPATVLSRRASKLGLARSLHERLMYECGVAYTVLDTQYRMSPSISSFPSRRFYDSKITNGENVCSPEYGRGSGLLEGRPYTFLQIDGVEEQGVGGSYRNHAEARMVVDLISQLQAQARSNPATQSSWFASDRIRIITFYQAQVSLLKRLLRDRGLGDKIVVATVDSSQGCEADIVIVSFVRSQARGNTGPNGAASARYVAGFLNDDRRMNVALTRAKFQLLCVGNVQGMTQMSGADTLQRLAKDALERGAVRSPPRERKNTNERLDLFYNPGGGGSGDTAKRHKLG